MRRDLYMNSVLTQYLRHIYVPAKQLVDLNLMKIAYLNPHEDNNSVTSYLDENGIVSRQILLTSIFSLQKIIS